MFDKSQIILHAKALTRSERKNIIISFKETDLHKSLKELFEAMEPNYTVEVTHGINEFGKDLVIVKKDHLGIDVIGVIVKKGDIKAKTLGQVDEIVSKTKNVFTKTVDKKLIEIESQITQAITHKSEMKSIFSKLPILKVLIVLVGDISSQARERLSKEIEVNHEIKDIDWLIDTFTDYYPQFFFEGNLINFIQERIQKLEINNLFQKRGKNLSDCFVEPIVDKSESPFTLDETNFSTIPVSKKFPFLQLKNLLDSSNKRIILKGDPGVGKSISLKKLAIDTLKESSKLVLKGLKKNKVNLPLLLSANEFLNYTDVESLLTSNIPKEIIEKFKINILMIDGLDEVTFEKRKEVIDKADLYAQNLSCSLVITTRKEDISNVISSKFEKYDLLPFEYNQALRLFEKLTKSKEVLGTLKVGLDRVKYKIPMVPLSLLLLIELVEEHQEIPASLTELYDRFFDLMLGRWDKEKGIQVLFDYYIKRKYLSELAYEEFFKKDRIEISNDEFDIFSNKYTEKYGWDHLEFGKFIEEIKRAGIIGIRKKVIFCHRSFLDYAVAEYIHYRRAELKDLDDFIVNIYFDNTWYDVAFFYIGMRKEINEYLLFKIFEREENNDKIELQTKLDKFMVGKLLQAGWHSPSDLIYKGLENAISITNNLRLSFENLTNKKGEKIPKILIDFIIYKFSEESFSSIFLSKELKKLFYKILNNPKLESVSQLSIIIWSSMNLFTKDEQNIFMNYFIDFLSKFKDLTIEEETRALLMLELLDTENEELNKSINRKLKKIFKNNPYVFKKLLPKKRKGFR